MPLPVTCFATAECCPADNLAIGAIFDRSIVQCNVMVVVVSAVVVCIGGSGSEVNGGRSRASKFAATLLPVLNLVENLRNGVCCLGGRVVFNGVF